MTIYRNYDRIPVLLVEMDPMCRQAVTHLLHDHCNVTALTKYNRIIEMMHHFAFQTLYVDYDLPSPGAIALFEEARRIAPNMKRVLMSGIAVRNLDVYLKEGLIHAFVTRISTVMDIRRAVLGPITSRTEH